nr:proline-rich receptor-like protein kinase PERK8 [Lolium perenne]
MTSPRPRPPTSSLTTALATHWATPPPAPARCLASAYKKAPCSLLSTHTPPLHSHPSSPPCRTFTESAWALPQPLHAGRVTATRSHHECDGQVETVPVASTFFPPPCLASPHSPTLTLPFPTPRVAGGQHHRRRPEFAARKPPSGGATGGGKTAAERAQGLPNLTAATTQPPPAPSTAAGSPEASTTAVGRSSLRGNHLREELLEEEKQLPSAPRDCPTSPPPLPSLRRRPPPPQVTPAAPLFFCSRPPRVCEENDDPLVVLTEALRGLHGHVSP